MDTEPGQPQPGRSRFSEWSRSKGIILVVALLVLCGTTYAAAALPMQSVGTRQLKKGAVGTKQLKNGAVTAAKVEQGSLTGTQINASTLGTVPNAAHAASADNAARADNASHAANADQLAGLAVSALQLRVSGDCSGGSAIANVNADGSVGCAGTGGPPSGPAGGDLTGTYPNPAIAALAVGNAKLANEAVNSAKVAANSLTGANIDESTLATVPNADTLDGKHASNFIQQGDVAGGDLTGTYPSPSIAGDAVTSAKVAPNSLTGADIDESTLGTVPNASHATNADNADTLDSLHATAFALAGSSAPPTGPASGDLTGIYPNPSVANGAITDAKVAAANKDGSPSTPSLRTLGTGAQQAMPGDATPGGPPTGSAGGALAGTYPNPTLKVTGGPCANGQALTNISSGAVLTCAPGVYSDGSSNVAAGPNPFPSLAGADGNSALGRDALSNVTSGNGNSALGQGALQADTTGLNNSAVGRHTLLSNTEGDANSALGFGALFSNTTGLQNTAVGDSALVFNTGGDQNTALGINAMTSNSAGSQNVAVGIAAGYFLHGDNNIDIGAFVGGHENESNTTRIGLQGTQEKTFLAGISGVTTGGVASPVLVDSEGQLGTTSSSRRFKQNIRPLGSQVKGLMALRPVSFRYRRSFVDGPNPFQFGLIAEQVAKVYPNLVVYGSDGKPSAVAYQELPALLLAQAQRQQRQNNALRAQNRRQGAQISRQQEQINWLIQHTRSR